MLYSKKLLPLFALLLCLSGGCKKKDKSATVSLEVANVKDSLVTLVTTNMITMDTILLASGRLDAKGNVTLRVDLENPTFVGISFPGKSAELLLEPGTRLDMRYDQKSAGRQPVFSGDGADVADALLATNEVRNGVESKNGVVANNAGEADFLSRGDSLQTELSRIYNGLKAKKGVSPEALHLVSALQRETVNFFYHNYLNAKYDGVDDPKMPAKIRSVVSRKLSADSAALRSNMYVYGLLLGSEMIFNIQGKVSDMMGKPPYDSTSTLEWGEIVDRELLKMDYPPFLKEFFRFKSLNMVLGFEGVTPAMQALREELTKASNQEYYKRSINKSFAMWEKLASGKPAPDFTGTTPDGKKLSLSDLKGKLVYVDVWATWCVPCVEEFPESKKLISEFEGDDKIAFLFVSVDQNVDSWKKMVAGNSVPKGVQMRQPQDNQADAIWNNYHIAGIPRYILINKDGTMLQSHAPRPSSGKVPELLRKYI